MKMTQAFKQLKKEYLATQPSELLREHGWEALAARIEEEQAQGLTRLWFAAKKPLFLIASVVLLVIFGSAGTVYAAQSAKPGDRLYPVKIASERIAARLAPEPWKDEVAQTIFNRRVKEAQEAAGRSDAEGAQRAKKEHERSVENLRSAGALTSDVATKAAERTKERINAIMKDTKKEEKKEEKKDRESPAPVAPPSVIPTLGEIPPLPSIGL